MNVKARRIVTLRLEGGGSPFEDWLFNLKSLVYRSAVDARLTRIRDGNFGDHKRVGEGVFELRLPLGPGLRIYYGLVGEELVILLGGGDKSTQKRDIKAALKLWKRYKDER